MRCLGERVRRLVDPADIASFQGFLAVGDGGFNGLHIRIGELLAILAHQLLGLVDERVGPIPRFDLFAFAFVLVSVRFGFLHHLIDVVLGQAAGRCNGDLLLLARSKILRGNVHNSVRIDVECDLDLRNAARCRRNTDKVELPERAVIPRHRALALEHMDLNRVLIVGSG